MIDAKQRHNTACTSCKIMRHGFWGNGSIWNGNLDHGAFLVDQPFDEFAGFFTTSNLELKRFSCPLNRVMSCHDFVSLSTERCNSAETDPWRSQSDLGKLLRRRHGEVRACMKIFLSDHQKHSVSTPLTARATYQTTLEPDQDQAEPTLGICIREGADSISHTSYVTSSGSASGVHSS